MWAHLQEKAGDKKAEGMLLDPNNGKRIIMVNVEALKSADRELEAALGFGAKIVMFRRGVGYGRHLAEQMKKSMTISDMLNSLANIVSSWGMGKLTLLPDSRNTFPLKIVLANCPFCSDDMKSKEPVCHFLAGSFAGFFMGWSGTEAKVKEVACTAMGSNACEFVVESSLPF